MNVIIRHYEPDNPHPYHTEEIEEVEKLAYDSSKNVYFVTKAGKITRVENKHRITISVTPKE